MSPLAGVRSAPPPFAEAAHWLLRRVCTSNPFYVISAGLFLIGLYASFESTGGDVEAWALMSGLGGYTLLLAVTALLLVRFARAWDDLRTVLLLVVLMFLATSVTFDEVLVLDPSRGIMYYLVGLLFAVIVSEGVLRGIRLRLPAAFRVPYYLVIGLFFLYPLVLSALEPPQPGVHSEALAWGLFGFSPIAGLVFLTLLPAIRCGAGYVADNGSPWRWPLYPWTLFGMLGLAVPARTFLLCWSMHLLANREHDHLIFGPYFVVPFGLCVAVLLLEIGLVSGSGGVLRIALAGPVVLAVLATIGHRSDPIYQEFLQTFTQRLGATPLFLTVLAAAAFYGYAALRRVRRSIAHLTAALLALTMIGPGTPEQTGLVAPQLIPILAVAVLQLVLGVLRRSAWHCLIGGVAVSAAVALALPIETNGVSWRTAVAGHLSLLALMAVGAAFHDNAGRLLRVVAGALALFACVIVSLASLTIPGAQMPWWLYAYVPIMSVLLASYGWMLVHRPSYRFAALCAAVWLATAAGRGYAVLRREVPGLDAMALGLAVFAVAVLISLAKSGLLSRWLAPAALDRVSDQTPH
jgi:hypothetical protein